MGEGPRVIREITRQEGLRTGALNVKGVGKQLSVFYREIPLFATVHHNVATHTIRLVCREEKYSIECKIPIVHCRGQYDVTHYGEWDSIEEAEEWLKAPEDLYKDY